MWLVNEETVADGRQGCSELIGPVCLKDGRSVADDLHPSGRWRSSRMFCMARFTFYRLTGDAKRRARIKFRSAAPSTKEWLRLIHYSSSCTIDDGSDAQVPSSSFFVLRDKALLVLVVRRLFAGDPRTRHLTLDHLKRYNQLLPRALIMVSSSIGTANKLHRCVPRCLPLQPDRKSCCDVMQWILSQVKPSPTRTPL